jgi:hypothetical protein
VYFHGGVCCFLASIQGYKLVEMGDATQLGRGVYLFKIVQAGSLIVSRCSFVLISLTRWLLDRYRKRRSSPAVFCATKMRPTHKLSTGVWFW